MDHVLIALFVENMETYLGEALVFLQPLLIHTVKERTSIPDSATFVGMTASSLPNINPTATAKTKSTSTSIMELKQSKSIKGALPTFRQSPLISHFLHSFTW